MQTTAAPEISDNRSPRPLPPNTATAGSTHSQWLPGDWLALSLVLAFAAALRLAFFNGFFGSDDVVYFGRSLAIAHGDWSTANYNGALRYGYNLPAGALIALFGIDPWAANAWPLLCSIAEIGVLFVLVQQYAGRRAAVFSALVLATFPLHVAVATRIHADSVVSLFLTLSFALLYFAERRGSRRLYFATGLAMGMVYWAKELAVLTLFAFLLYGPLYRRPDRRWLYVLAGGLTMLAAHLLLMQIVAGDPLHLIKTVTGQMQRSFISQGQGEDGVGYYFRYLLLDPKHTWLAPLLALGAIGTAVLHWRNPSSERRLERHAIWWLLSLLLVLTLTPVSLQPLRFAMKQSNYLTLFLAPLALLAGLLLARLRWGGTVLLAAVLLGGMALGALEQRAYRVFTANSRAAITFAAGHPDDWLLGSANNGNLATVATQLGQVPGLDLRFGYLLRPASERSPELGERMRTRPSGYVVFDRETLGWGMPSWRGKLQAPACWQPVDQLKPQDDDLSLALVQGSIDMAGRLSPALGARLQSALMSLLVPQSATVYRVEARDLWCGADAPPG